MAARRPQDLVFTLFGDYLLHRPDPVWVGSLIALLRPLGLTDGAVRTVLSRMTKRGWLTSARDGRRSYYDLTARGRRLLEEGEARIYHPSWDQPWDGRWFLLAYSIPEESRHLRHRLRDRLSWLGFGSLGNGLWMSPYDLEVEVAEVAESLGIEDYLEWFRTEDGRASDPSRLVSKCWDLPAINERYEDFIEKYASEFERCRDGLPEGEIEAEECFVLRFELIHEYREFPFLDPYLPRPLLPKNWAGECAAHLFRVFHDLLTQPADQCVDTVLSEAPMTAPTGA